MKIIPKLLVTVLMSALTSVVFAQTPTNKLDALKISTEDVFKVKYALNRYRNLWEEDSVMVEALLKKTMFIYQVPLPRIKKLCTILKQVIHGLLILAIHMALIG